MEDDSPSRLLECFININVESFRSKSSTFDRGEELEGSFQDCQACCTMYMCISAPKELIVVQPRSILIL